MTDATAQPDDYRTTASRLALAGSVAIVAAFTADVAIYLVARAIDAIPDDLPDGAESVSVAGVAIAVLLTMSVATVAMGLFDRFSAHPVKNFSILTAIVLFTSIQAPLGIEDAPRSLEMTLLLMHVATALIAWWCLTRLSRVA